MFFVHKIGIWLLLLICVGLLVGCAPRSDAFAPFRGAYFAEVSGELYGISFSATVEMAAETDGGARAATITFYAPETLAGTTVTRNGAGEVTVLSGGVRMPDAGGIGAALFSLFPAAGEITEVSLTDEGYTRVCGVGFVLLLRADGTPLEIKTDAVSATVVRWEQK